MTVALGAVAIAITLVALLLNANKAQQDQVILGLRVIALVAGVTTALLFAYLFISFVTTV